MRMTSTKGAFWSKRDRLSLLLFALLSLLLLSPLLFIGNLLHQVNQGNAMRSTLAENFPDTQWISESHHMTFSFSDLDHAYLLHEVNDSRFYYEVVFHQTNTFSVYHKRTLIFSGSYVIRTKNQETQLRFLPDKGWRKSDFAQGARQIIFHQTINQ